MAKKHGHEEKHAHCDHCLHACDHCDVAYCCDCNREWGTCRLYHYWSSPWTIQPTIRPYTPYWGTTTAIGDATAERSGSSLMVTNSLVGHAHGHEN